MKLPFIIKDYVDDFMGIGCAHCLVKYRRKNDYVLQLHQYP